VAHRRERVALAPPAVLEAYGCPHDLDDEEILERLLALNLERAGSLNRQEREGRKETLSF